MRWHCYLRRGAVFLPTTGKVDKNVYFLVEPVAVIPVSNTGALRTALRETIARGNPVVEYDREAPPVLCKYAGVKSWSTFARNASLWVMDDTNGALRIEPNTRDSRGAFSPDKTVIETLPAGSTIDDLTDRMIAVLQEAAANRDS
ncbi:MAG TPA: hypothetical protein VG328_17735 [Stellaceae bacterium]|jgi:hypothetical protein|nr:hypothetical protein [Stellaceae bacterium]